MVAGTRWESVVSLILHSVRCVPEKYACDLRTERRPQGPGDTGPPTGVHLSPGGNTQVNKERSSPIQLLVSSILMRLNVLLRLCKL